MSEAPPPIRAGQSADVAVPRLVAQHGGRLYSLALRLCRRREDAEDLVQEIFLQAYRKWHTFDGRSSPTTWLYTIAVRLCRRRHRPRAGQPRTIHSLDEMLPFAEPRVAVAPARAAEAAVRPELRERAEAAIAELPAEFRLPLVLKEIVGLSVTAVAEVLGLKEATVKTRLHRARLRVRNGVSAGLPHRAAPPPAYDRRVCLDLLHAKQEALDRGVRFPANDVMCERCQAVFASLDLTQDVCRQIGHGELPATLRARLVARLGA